MTYLYLFKVKNFTFKYYFTMLTCLPAGLLFLYTFSVLSISKQDLTIQIKPFVQPFLVEISSPSHSRTLFFMNLLMQLFLLLMCDTFCCLAGLHPSCDAMAQFLFEVKDQHSLLLRVCPSAKFYQPST